MVKNLPTIERSTKIRFGKNVTADQAENTIVFNASNTEISATTPSGVYMTPIRMREDYDDSNVVIMMYNNATKEITRTNENAVDLLNTTLDVATSFGNVVNISTVQFNNTEHDSFVTYSNVGIMNTNPQHTLSIGSKVYFSDTGSNVLAVTGNVSILGKLVVNGGVTTISTENLEIGDAIIELGKGNAELDSKIDLGLIMSRPESNVTVGFKEDTDELIIAYTDSSAEDIYITPNTSESLNVHVYGRIFTESNVGILNTSDSHTLDVGSKLYIDEYGSNVLYMTGNAYIDGNISVTGNIISSQITQLETDLTDNALRVSTLETDLTDNALRVSTLETDLTSNASRVTILETDLTSNASRVTTLETDLTSNASRVTTLETDLTSNASRVTTLETDLTSNASRVTTLETDLTSNASRVTTLETDLTSNASRVTTLETDLTSNASRVTTLETDLTSNASRVTTLETDLTSNASRVTTLETDLTSNASRVTTLETDLTSNASRVTILETDLTDNASRVTTLETDLTSNASRVTTLETDLADNSARISALTLDDVTNVNNATSNTVQFTNPTTAFTTDLTSNVEVKLNQLANVVIDTATLATEGMLVYDGSNWTNQLQNHTFLYAKAEETIGKGDAVYATGTIGNNTFTVRKARSNSSTTMPALGLAYQDLALNEEGLIVTFGRADGVNTDGFQTGETVYVSNVTAGALSNVKPYASGDLIQNIGLVVKGHDSAGIVSVTGVGRSNDIPNAPIVTDEGDINYVYVNDQNNDLKKIEPSNLLTQLQTLQQVTDTGNTTSNTIQFTNATTGLVTTSNLQVGSNISVAGLTDPQKKYLTMVNQDGFLQKSPVYVDKDTGVYVIEAAEAEFQGNLTLSGNTTILNSESVTISDRIFGVAANNSVSQLDSGFMIEHQDGGAYANIALIYHADEHRFSISHTQNTFTDDHILHYDDPSGLIIDLRGNVQVQKNTTISETLDVTGAATFANDLTVGAVSNLFVDVSTSRVGINEASPQKSLDVNGDARVQSTTDTSSKTAGALVVSGGLGVASNIHSTNVYATSRVGVGTNAASAPLHILVSGTGETTNGIYMKSAAGSSTNDAIVNLEVASDGGDAFMTWNASGGTAFAMGLDRSESLLTISNSSSSLNTNPRLRMATDGAVTLTNATNATSKTTGSLIIGGGVGVAGDIHATNTNFEDVEADSVTVTDATAAVSKATGALIISNGGLGVAGDIYATNTNFEDVEADSVTITDSTPAVSKATGALIISNGGLGVAGNIHATNTNFEDVEADSVTVTDSTPAVSKATGALIISNGGLGVAGDIYATNTNFEDVEADSVTITDSTPAVSKATGALIISNGGLGVAGDIHATNTNFEDVEADSVTVTDTTAAVSKATGALIISNGGLGVAGDIHATNTNFENVEADSVTVTDSTPAVSKATGALIISNGGLGVAGNVYATDVIATSNLTVDTNTLHVDSINNRVGIGLTTPEYTLDVHGTSNVGALTATSLTVDTNTLYVDSLNNRVGVGTTTPDATLHVSGNAYISSELEVGNYIRAAYDQDITSYLGRAAIGYNGVLSDHASFAHIDHNNASSYALRQSSTGTTDLNATSGQTLYFKIDDSEKAKITSTGNFVVDTNTLFVDAASNCVGVNTTSPTSNLHVEGNVYVSDTIYAGDDITAFSDRRLKTEFKVIEDALQKIDKVSGYTYEKIDEPGKRKTGVIAQEILEILPEAIHGSENTMYSVAYGNMAGLFIEAIKELKNRIEVLEAKIK